MSATHGYWAQALLGFVVAALLLGGCGFAAKEASAQTTRFWTQPSAAGNFSSPGNWTDGVAPNDVNQIGWIAGNPTTGVNFTLTGNMTMGALIYSNGVGRGLTGTGTLFFHQTTGGGIATYWVTEGVGWLDLSVDSIVLNSTTNFNIENAGGIHINSPISGSGGLRKSGNARLSLFGNNTYTGTTSIEVGTLRLGNSNSNIPNGSAVTVNSGATMDLNGFNETIGSLSGAGNVTLGSGTLLTGSTSSTFSGVISGSGGLTKVGTGTFTLSGNNTYTGATAISAGTLSLGASNRIANGSAVTVNSGATLNLNGFNETIGLLSGAGNVWLDGGLGDGRLTTGGSDGSTFSGVISGGGGVTKLGTGMLILSGNNMYAGDTIISEGTLRLGNNNSNIPNGSAVTVNSGATLDLNNFNETIRSLAGAGNVTLGSGALLTGNSSSTFSGLISGTGRLQKVGTGTTLTLSGSNTYTGPTWIDAGTLRLGASNRIANSSDVDMLGGATFDLNNFNETIRLLNGAGNVTLGSGTLTTGGSGNSTYFGVISGTGRLTKVGTGTLTLSGNNTYTGVTWIQAGTLRLGGSERIADSSHVEMSTGGGTFDLNGFDETIGSLSSSSGTGSVTLGSGTLTIGANNNSSGFTGVISGTGGVRKVGTESFTLSGNNTYTGATTINEGTLRLGGSNRIANGSAVSVSSGATFDLNNFDEWIGSLSGSGNVTLGSGALLTGNTSSAFSGVISGTGRLQKVGTGTLTLSGNNTYTGPTLIDRGTLRLGGSERIADSSTIDLLGGATFDLNNFSETIGLLVSGGNLTLGSGALTATGANTTLFPSNTLSIGLAGTAQYGRLTATDAATLGGTLEVALLGGFMPSAGDSFDILDWGSLSGMFATVNLPTLAGGLTWNDSALYTTGILTVVATGLPGDYNNNGVVDAADYTVWRNNDGLGSLPNDQGVAPGAAQYALWKVNYGATAGVGAGSLSSTAAVPEPATGALLLLSLLAMLKNRQKGGEKSTVMGDFAF